MKVFVSSLIAGFEAYRSAAVEAIEVLGHEAVMAEGFSALPATPEQACLAAVRESDVMVLLLGDRYGSPQESGLSPTEEEYREARERIQVLVFTEQGVQPEPRQAEFLSEVEGWSTGHFRSGFSSPDELRAAVTRGLHDLELALSSGPVDETEMLDRARNLVPQRHGFAGAELVVVVAGGPRQQVIRPAALEASDLARDLQREALFGDHAVLDPSEGTSVAVVGDALVLKQRDGSVAVDQMGTVQLTTGFRDSRFDGIPSVIIEDLTIAVADRLMFAGSTLDRVDPLHRVTDVAVVMAVLGSGYMPWRTRAEHESSPNAASMGGGGGGGGDVVVHLTPARRHRQALIHDSDRIAEDLVVLAGRERRP